MRTQTVSVLTRTSCNTARAQQLSCRALFARPPAGGRRWESNQSHSRPGTKPAPFGFAFDIDGVLLRSASPLPGAGKALRYLQDQKIPFILLTNGGGKTEEERVEDLSQKLDVQLGTENFMQSHTPFQELVHGQPGGKEGLKEQNVLVVGGEHNKCRDVAEKYGFKHAITPGDIFCAYPEIWPFSSPFLSYYESFARPLPKPLVTDAPISHSKSKLASLSPKDYLQISSIHVYNDPRDWGLDTSIMLDTLLSHRGFIGTRSKLLNDKSLPNRGYQQDGQPSLWFSNADLEWAASWQHPRLGQGGFREAFEGVYSAMTDPDKTGEVSLIKTIIGKPYFETYSYAEKLLNDYRKTLLASNASSKVEDLERVYMVGDNPESDIRGANDYKSPLGTKWESILLRSGVYDEDSMGKPKYTPTVLKNDVLSGVQWALEQEGWSDRI